MKLILSRKGFDASAGGMPSPILPDGTLLSLPIPMRGEGITLGEIPAPGEWGTLGDIAHDLSTRRRTPRDPNTEVHLDPDLIEGCRRRVPGWRPLFGQAGAAQTHLDRQGVNTGDLSLFFGWFRQAENGPYGLCFKPGAPDRHVIFGWMQIGEIFRDMENVPDWARYHPHVTRRFHGRNVIYAASERLTLPDGTSCGLPGAGALKGLSDACVLTEPGHPRSHWLLPGWFLPEQDVPTLTYHADPLLWERVGEHVRLQTAGRGQEFVLDLSDIERPASDWLRLVFGRRRRGRRRALCNP